MLHQIKCRMSILGIVIRHCSRCAAKTELCVTRVFLGLWFLSIPKSSRHVRWMINPECFRGQLIHPKDLAVDLLRKQPFSE